MPIWLIVLEAMAALLLGAGGWIASFPTLIGAVRWPFDFVVYGAITLLGTGWLIATAGLFWWLIQAAHKEYPR